MELGRKMGFVGIWVEELGRKMGFGGIWVINWGEKWDLLGLGLWNGETNVIWWDLGGGIGEKMGFGWCNWREKWDLSCPSFCLPTSEKQSPPPEPFLSLRNEFISCSPQISITFLSL